MIGTRWLAVFALAGVVFAQGTGNRRLPRFEPDPSFPKLPNNWVLGNVGGVAIDRHDNVWVIHRPRSIAVDKTAEGKTAAPPVLEFDASGKFLQSWGGDGQGYDWPDSEHNIFVDQKDNVWISGSSPGGQSKTTRSDDMLIKFTNRGKFLFQVGGRDVSLGSKDTKSVNKPGDLFVSAKTNEVYLADGYGNRRVVVFDAETGAFKRMWGAFGVAPEDDEGSGGRGASGGPAGVRPAGAGRGAGRGAAPPPVLETDGPGPAKFSSPVHGIVVSNDDTVYVADRSNRRVQLFTRQGHYLGQIFINRAGPSPDSASGLALSPDKGQQFLYMADFGNSRVVVVDRKKLEVLYQFGTRGAEPGQFQGLHHLAVDSKGNLYTAEVAPGARLQRFAFKGLAAGLPPNALTAAQLAGKP
jgi:DNA-binding beta-propeller fold protein YncE